MADILLEKADILARDIYRVTKEFPKDELYGLTSQLRRASLSIPLNIVEGFARQRKPSHRQFLEVAYGSLSETEYLLRFAARERYIAPKEYELLNSQTKEVGRILWATLRTLKKQLLVSD